MATLYISPKELISLLFRSLFYHNYYSYYFIRWKKSKVLTTFDAI